MPCAYSTAFRTLRRAAWADRTALVLCDVHDQRAAGLLPVAADLERRRPARRSRRRGIWWRLWVLLS